MDVDDFDSDVEFSDPEVYDSDGDDNELGLSTSIEIRRPPSFEALDEAVLLSSTNALLQEVSDILSMPRPTALILMRQYNWNKEKLINAYTENKEKVLAAAHASETLEKKPKSKKPKYVCPICEDTNLGTATYALSCGHRFCRDCWGYYLSNALNEAPKVVTTTHCMSPKCLLHVHDAAWCELLPTSESKDRYHQFLNICTITDNPLLKYCPAPGCTKVMRVDVRERTRAVKCKCGFDWCFSCHDSDIGDHMPATCKQVADWRERETSESENIKWLIANTKQCPKCRRPIEKNGGCMHMTCNKSSGGCGFEFCWLCRGDWKEHGTATGGYYNCNKYSASEAANEDQKSESIKTELEYYKFYYHRYDSHKQASKVADDQRRKALERGKELVENLRVRSTDVEFLVAATDQLTRNRRVLRWSYVFAYCLKTGTAEKNLLEFLQEQLEKFTDALSKQYERKTDDIPDIDTFNAWKGNVINLIRVTDSFFTKFIEGVQKGLLN